MLFWMQDLKVECDNRDMVCMGVLSCGTELCLSGDEYKWDEASEAVLWSLVEKYKRELYNQKNGYTRNEYLDKITQELCAYSCGHLFAK